MGLSKLLFLNCVVRREFFTEVLSVGVRLYWDEPDTISSPLDLLMAVLTAHDLLMLLNYFGFRAVMLRVFRFRFLIIGA